IKDIETKLRNKAKHAEFYYVFNPKTGEGVAHSSGWPEAVFFSPDIDDYIRGLGENNISIHNHPGRNDQTNKEDVPPSLTDINLVTTHKVGEVRIVGESMTMVVTIKKFDTAFFHEVMKPAFRQYSQDHVTDYIPDFFDVPPTEIDVGGFPNAEYQRMRLRTDSSYAEQVSIYQRAQWRWFANEFSEHFDYKEIPYDDSD
ncbi:MAG: hypothetical protein GTN64_05780, partial [Candidatus Latescibacteria bacterium]|nr:hypothetical protein [Candidatus Latescibacterota bacterium]NIO78117.1 hypothetical protein [Candidatus Latescibacterota bacterium]